jgi:hypothetical protein
VKDRKYDTIRKSTAFVQNTVWTGRKRRNMEYRKFGNTYVIRIDRGEEIVASLKEICRKEKIFCASVQAIGAVDDFEIGLFNVETKKYCSEHYHFPAESHFTFRDGHRKRGRTVSASAYDGSRWLTTSAMADI